MIVYFKCSFRSSHGFTMGRYDIDTKQLNFLSEKRNDSDNLIPKTIEYTVSHQLGRCLVLATDENGYYFFGVYRLTEGNDDKYVNAVFYDINNQNQIIALYNYFCSTQCDSTKKLISSVKRVEGTLYNNSNLEYEIDSEVIGFIVSNTNVNADNRNRQTKHCSPNSLLAFITTDKYNDYQIILEEKFNVKKSFQYEKLDINDNQISNYHRATKNVYKDLLPFSIPLLLAIGVIGIIGLIVTLIVILL